jgi:hypothetical protein
VTFAACIQVPGGFVGSNEGLDSGSALLRKNVAFKTFVITDTISMALSTCAVFIHLWIPFMLTKRISDERNLLLVFRLAFKFIYLALLVMVVAFINGTYAVAGPSFDLDFSNWIIGTICFGILYSVIKIFKLKE